VVVAFHRDPSVDLGQAFVFSIVPNVALAKGLPVIIYIFTKVSGNLRRAQAAEQNFPVRKSTVE